jgi:chromatin remodeling complex protein RSC6
MATAKKAAAKKAPAQETAVAAPVAAPVVEAAPAVEAKKPNAAFMKPMTPSKLLAAVVGKNPLPRTEVTKKVWEYIKKHDLQDPANKRMINADKKLKAIFGKDQVSMFEMTKLISNQLS